MENRLKKVIFKKLYEDLSGVEIIPFENSIWFIDRDKRYWYFEYQKSGELYWRSTFFYRFFELFSMQDYEFKPIISEWVEEVLNRKVDKTVHPLIANTRQVEEVLNRKVDKTDGLSNAENYEVEEVLNRKVDTTSIGDFITILEVEYVLKS